MGRFKLKLYKKHNMWWCHYCLNSNYTFNIEDIVAGTGITKEEACESWKKLTREGMEIGEESNLGGWLLIGASVSALVSVVLFVLSHVK